VFTELSELSLPLSATLLSVDVVVLAFHVCAVLPLSAVLTELSELSLPLSATLLSVFVVVFQA
jgi:hypothetical protein